MSPLETLECQTQKSLSPPPSHPQPWKPQYLSLTLHLSPWPLSCWCSAVSALLLCPSGRLAGRLKSPPFEQPWPQDGSAVWTQNLRKNRRARGGGGAFRENNLNLESPQCCRWVGGRVKAQNLHRGRSRRHSKTYVVHARLPEPWHLAGGLLMDHPAIFRV